MRVVKVDREGAWWCVYDDDGREAAELQLYQSSGRLGDGPAWSIWSVQTRAEYRRRGLMRGLIARALLYASRMRQYVVRLWVFRDNHAARRLYESLGFTYISDMSFDTLTMECRIDKEKRKMYRKFAATIA